MSDQQGVGNRRFTTDQAVRACQEAVTEQAAQRFRGAQLTFRTTTLDDQPGRHDWVVGIFDAHTRGQGESFRFSCSVNFDNGQVRSAEIEPLQDGLGSRGYDDRTPYSSRQSQTCERAVLDRFRRDGYSNVDINPDSRQWRRDLIVGSVRADRRGRPDSFSFSCSLDPASLTVRSIDLKRR